MPSEDVPELPDEEPPSAADEQPSRRPPPGPPGSFGPWPPPSLESPADETPELQPRRPWPALPQRKRRHRAHFVMKTTAICFLVSAAFEIATLTDEIPLFGAMRGGAVTVLYHLIYFFGFVLIGVDMWRKKPRGFWALQIATVLYTIDRGTLLFDKALIREQLIVVPQIKELAPALGPAGMEQVILVSQLTLITIIGCWWAFAWYVYSVRDWYGLANPRQKEREAREAARWGYHPLE